MTSVFKAQAIGEQAIPNLALSAILPLPDEAGRGQMWADAETVVTALCASLPGGTLDAVTCLLLERQASALRVRHPQQVVRT